MSRERMVPRTAGVLWERACAQVYLLVTPQAGERSLD